ncbi:MAG: DUF1214 domain-containing protein [Pseudomonadota bacterium]
MIRYALGAILGAALGVASALYLAGLWPGMKPLDFGNVEVDGWRSDFAIGSEAADPYTRARVARHGLLALANSEAVYFTKTTGTLGVGEISLTEQCDFLLSGGPMPAKWWSITLYDEDSLLPMNDDGALSVDATSVTLEEDGTWRAIISAKRSDKAPNWISSRNAGGFDLTLRLYEPSGELLSDPETALTPPTIEALACTMGVS